MPAQLDDPQSPTIYRTSGDPPYPNAFTPLPSSILPRLVTLRDRITTATLIPIASLTKVPLSLLAYLCAQMNKEIEKGDTYPMTDLFTVEYFGAYWFANFVGIMLLGEWGSTNEEVELRLAESARVDRNWEKECMGSFYIKPNYPGRSSHVCNGGFLVTDGLRSRGVGRLMGEAYLDWAPKLNYVYSVFNLVYETNVASCRIWDALGFKRIGRVKGCGNLKSYDEPVDAIIYGRELSEPSPDDFLSEERFEKIKYYLKNQKYPERADRAEKSRLRSAALHYRLVTEEAGNESGEPVEKLYLKDKEVIADPQKQYEIARTLHKLHHEGINKTTARVAEKYHWVRIKDTATLAIKNCADCNDPQKNASAANSKTVHGGSPGEDVLLDQPMPNATSIPQGVSMAPSLVMSSMDTRLGQPIMTMAPQPQLLSGDLSAMPQYAPQTMVMPGSEMPQIVPYQVPVNSAMMAQLALQQPNAVTADPSQFVENGVNDELLNNLGMSQ